MKYIGVFILIICSSFSLARENDTVKWVDTLHKPKTAVILSAIIPGAGQFYNDWHRQPNQKIKSWWKLPIIYGGIGTSIYFIGANQKEFNYYYQKRIELANNTGTHYYSDAEYTIIQNTYRKWRDMSVVSTIGFYALNLIDATVAGHLLHFDNSKDLSINLVPVLNSPNLFGYNGFKLNFTF